MASDNSGKGSWQDPADQAAYRRRSRRGPTLRRREDTLRDFYGGELAAPEIEAHQPPARPLAGLVDELLRRMNMGDQVLMRRVVDNWPIIAGPELARHSSPQAIRKGCLDVEVHNATWLFTLKTQGKRPLEERLAGFTEGRLSKVFLKPGGATPRQRPPRPA